MSIVMGLDQHRAQITAEWIDTATGEVSRGRIAPADRDGVRKFLARFRGRELEVAFEATTGWRFVVEELRAVGASVHLAEAAHTSALWGPKQHAKNDRADARHLRELLMTGRLPECWIPPDHLLDLRARSGCVTRSWTTAVSGSNGCRLCCTTTVPPNAPVCSPVRTVRG
jgi:transposase